MPKNTLIALFALALVTVPAQANAQTGEVRATLIDTSGNDMRDAYTQVDGCARRIAIAEPEHPFVTGCGNGEETAIYYMGNTGKFEALGANAVTIAPMTSQVKRGRGYVRIGGDRRLVGVVAGTGGAVDPDVSCIREIALGSSNPEWQWALTCPASPSARDYPIARRAIGGDQSSKSDVIIGHSVDTSFHEYPGGAVRIAAGITDAVAWAVNSDGNIWRQTYCKGGDPDESLIDFCKSVAESWEQIPGCARSISNGGSNRVWVIGCDPDKRGNASIYQYTGPTQSGPLASNPWIKRAGRGKEIAVDPDGRPWVVMANGTIWRWSGDVPAKGQAATTDPSGPKAADPK